MTELETVRTFYRFNAGARHRYLETILSLSGPDRLKDRGASYPSLQEIYVHVLDALRFWFELVPQDRVGEALSRELPARSLTDAQLREETGKIERIVDDFLAPLGPTDLAREIICHFPTESGSPGPERRIIIGDILWHMIEEEFQHRGELNALLWQVDVDPPIGTFEQWVEAKSERMYEP